MAYIDPNTPGVLARVLAPIFILVSVLWIQFKQRFTAFLLRGRRPEDKG